MELSPSNFSVIFKDFSDRSVVINELVYDPTDGLLKEVLKNLSQEDLSRAACVCKDWNNVARPMIGNLQERRIVPFESNISEEMIPQAQQSSFVDLFKKSLLTRFNALEGNRQITRYAKEKLEEEIDFQTEILDITEVDIRLLEEELEKSGEVLNLLKEQVLNLQNECDENDQKYIEKLKEIIAKIEESDKASQEKVEALKKENEKLVLEGKKLKEKEKELNTKIDGLESTNTMDRRVIEGLLAMVKRHQGEVHHEKFRSHITKEIMTGSLFDALPFVAGAGLGGAGVACAVTHWSAALIPTTDILALDPTDLVNTLIEKAESRRSLLEKFLVEAGHCKAVRTIFEEIRFLNGTIATLKSIASNEKIKNTISKLVNLIKSANNNLMAGTALGVLGFMLFLYGLSRNEKEENHKKVLLAKADAKYFSYTRRHPKASVEEVLRYVRNKLKK